MKPTSQPWNLCVLPEQSTKVLANDMVIAEVKSINPADALLICAAPDLLYAACLMMDAIKKTDTPVKDIPHIAHAYQFLNMAVRKSNATCST